MNFLPDVEHVANRTKLQEPFSEELPNMEMLIKLATFWPGATREPFGGLFSGHGALRTSGFPIHTYMHKYICGLLMKLATFWLGATKGLLEAFFRKLEPFETEPLPDV